MSWLSIVLFIIMHIPDILGIIQKIIDLIHGMPKELQAQARHELSEAIKSGDKDAVKAVAAKWQGMCEQGGVGCPADLVKE